jgi:hypothetical protein
MDNEEYKRLRCLVYSDRATADQVERFRELIEVKARDEALAELAAYRGPLRNQL